jgi:tetratricopeptide (TPR) repeat protein
MSTAPLLDTPASLNEARQHHAQGDLLQAAEAYRQSLAAAPRSHQALLGLSLIGRQSNQLRPALHMAQAALAAHPGSALAWANLGDVLIAQSHTSHDATHNAADAKAAFRQALALQPDLAAAHYGLGNTLALEDNFTAALSHFTSAVQQCPASSECRFAQAFAHGRLGDHVKAIAAYRRAVQLRPRFAAAWLNLGVELVADGRDQLAEPCYIQALAAAPNPAQCNTYISAHLNLGHLHRGRQQFGQAQHHYESALNLASAADGRLAEIHVAFTYFHLEQQQFPQAWQSLRAAQGADPQALNPEIPNACGILLLAEESTALPPTWVPHVSTSRCGTDSAQSSPLIQQSIHAFAEAEALNHKTAASNRGNAILRLGHVEAALAAHQAALQRDPHHPGVLYNLALTQLRAGDFTHGWANYEIRWQFREVHPHPRRFPQPRWQGEPLPATARLLIYSEQGLGDTIQFIRYLSLVRWRSPHTHLIVEVQRPLVPLLAFNLNVLCHPERSKGSASNLLPNAEILPHGQPLTSFTHHIPLLSLPALFKTTLETVPAKIPYLHANPKSLNEIGPTRLTFHPAIGLNWAGNPNYRADHERSTTLQTFLPLLEIPNIHWISLQHGPPARQAAQLPPHLHPYDPGDRDLAAAAALIAQLDLVITTDTAVAHLAGALGKPLWLLLPWQSDWRWMQHCLTTPWYPQARLFRQSSPNNWPELITRVALELRSTWAAGR